MGQWPRALQATPGCAFYSPLPLPPARLSFLRSPTARAEGAKLKSRRDAMIIAQGKRSAALGYGSLPRAAASAALPLAYRAGPPGRRKGEPDRSTGRRVASGREAADTDNTGHEPTGLI